ncbi:unnamed protein product [Microthlaspi erraticum]|nr:unnamed protein product [Microthlaspi erraticum]
MGFRDLHRFNMALLGKQAWRILQNPQSLLSRIYKGRYHKSSTFLESVCGGGPSYGWRSIQAGKDLLKKGLQVRLGDGKVTKVWSDHWLPVVPPRVVQGNVGVGNIRDLNMHVEELWKPGIREWDEAKLVQLLAPEDVEIVKSIRLSRFANEDVFVWPYTTNTVYTVKSGYWVATHVVEDGERIEPPPGPIEVKKKIWKLQIPPKIQHFLWKTIAGAIPTAERLCSRILNIDPMCQRCCLYEETINHVLFNCQHANSIWRCAGFTQFDRSDISLEDNIRMLFQILEMQSLTEEKRFLPMWMSWMIWKSRNDFLFAHRNVHPQNDVEKGVQAVAEWFIANPSTTIQERRICVTPTSCWEPPSSGWLKCNFDSTYRSSASCMGVGWIIRDDKGQYIESGWAKLPQVDTPLQAEANGFLYVVQRI